jgi:hypothetical protein
VVPYAVMKTTLPALPFASWRPTKETLHLFTQIVGKIRLALAPPRNHWWHVSLRVTPRGLTTGFVPHGDGGFEIELDLLEHGLETRTSAGDLTRIALRDGVSVATCHRRLFEQLHDLGIRPRIRAKPYDVPFAKAAFAADERHAAYDAAAAATFGTILRWTAGVLEQFAGRFHGKSSPVHFFWHSFDLAMTRFSGRRAPPIPGANEVTRQAYSHEVASFGFWPGDADTSVPTFYGYAAPVPAGLRGTRLLPSAAKWLAGSGQARLSYDVVRRSRDPAKTLTSFWESVANAAQTCARWDEAKPRSVARAESAPRK